MMTHWDIVWLAAGMALTTATQLRFGGGAIGPGEVMLAVWLLWMGSRILILQSHLISPVVKAVLWFWLVSCAALACGTVVASLQGTIATDLQHTTLAITLVLLFSIGFTISIASLRQLNFLLACFTAFTTVALTLSYFLPLPLITPWIENVRFSGWSANPNQTALALLPVPFFTLHLLQHSRSPVGKLWYAALTAAALFVGIATHSDALLVGWLLGCLWLVVCAIDRMVVNASVAANHAPERAATQQALVRLLLGFAAVVSLVIFYYAFQSLATEVYAAGGQGSDRLRLWMNGLAAILRSPLVGFGPGSHSGPTAPFLNYEAHNTFIDWTTSAGFVGLASYAVFLSWLGWNTWRYGSPILFAAFIAMLTFSSFHYVLRQPLFWFSLLAIAESNLFSATQRTSSLAARMQPQSELAPPLAKSRHSHPSSRSSQYRGSQYRGSQ